MPSSPRPLSFGFAPVAGPGARILILGTLPGRASLGAAQYYAQPRNAFWPIMGALYGARPELPYADRLERLVSNGIALWDVCAAAHRPGSLDSAIDLGSLRANAFAEFYRGQPQLGLVCLNGLTAARLYARCVQPTLGGRAALLRQCVLPSTSPAHATLSLAQKRAAWQAALGTRPQARTRRAPGSVEVARPGEQPAE